MRLIISGNIAPSEITEFNQTSPTHPGAPGTVILPCASEVEGPITNVTVYPASVIYTCYATIRDSIPTIVPNWTYMQPPM